MLLNSIVCDECEDEDDRSARGSVIRHENGHIERLDLCDFCRDEIAGATAFVGRPRAALRPERIAA